MSNSESEQYDLLDRLAEEFADRFRRGERPALKEYTDRYPELADDIRELFPAMVKVERAEDLRQGDDEHRRDSRADRLTACGRSATTGSCARSAGAGWGSYTRPSRSRWAGGWRSRSCRGRCSGDRMTQERFRREARAAARLHHTNIVPVFEVGQDGDVRFYAMQFIQGLGLDAVITELRRLRGRAGSEHEAGAASGDRSSRSREEHSAAEPGEPDTRRRSRGQRRLAVNSDRSIRRWRPGRGGWWKPRPSTLARALAGGLADTGRDRDGQAARSDSTPH